MREALLEKYYITIALARDNGDLNWSGSNGNRVVADYRVYFEDKTTALVMP